MRADAAASLPDTCTIRGLATVEDERGGDEAIAPPVKATGVACLLAPTRVGLTGTESGGLYGPLASRGFTLDTTASVWLGTFPYGTDLALDDEVVLESGPAAGQRFEVINVDDALGFATTLGAKLIRAGVTNAE